MKELFDIHIIKDTLKRLRIIGITLGVILAIEAIAIPIMKYISSYNYLEDYEPAVQFCTLSDIHPFIYLIYFAFAPIFTLVIFNFLNHRNACDFFHAVPKKRSTIYVSMITGIMIWIAILTVGSSFVSVIVSLFMTSVYVLSASGVIVVCIGVLVASFYLVATVALAMSLTGNVFNNFVVSFMILLIPRIVITVVTSIVLGNIPIVSSAYSSIPLLDNSYNIYFSTYTNLFGVDGDIFTFKSIIYTLVLAFIYFIIALFVFKKRKSEAAGLAAPTSVLQAVFRIVICLVICLAPLYFLAEDYIFNSYYSPFTIYLIVILYVVAIVVYFVYEIIATKSVRTLAKAAKQLIIVAIANVMIVLFMFIGYNVILNYQPTKDEIKYVSIDFEHSYLYDGYYVVNDNSYFLANTKNYKISNDKIKEIISESLRENCEFAKENGYMNYGDFTLAVDINSGGFTRQRLLSLNSSDVKEIIDCLSEDEEYINYIKFMPTYDELADNAFYSIDSPLALNSDQVEELYKMLYDYYNSLPTKEWLKKTVFNSEKARNIYATMSFTLTKDDKSYNGYIPITDDTPDIAEKYVNYCIENEKENLKSVLKSLNGDVKKSDGHLDMELSIYNYLDFEADPISLNLKKTYNDYHYNPLNITRDYSDEELDLVLSILNDAQNNKYDSDKKLIQCYFSYYDNETAERNSYSSIIALTKDQYNTLYKLSNERLAIYDDTEYVE